MKKILFLAAMLAAYVLPAQAEGDVSAGKGKAATCVACHGADGKVSIPLYPNLAGQNARYLAEALHAYKKGERKGGQAEIMKLYAMPLSDQEIDDLAAYYASLQP